MTVYSSPNAYTPLLKSRIFDADVIFASIDHILATPPRTRLFRPEGFDGERWLFSKDIFNLPVRILNDISDALGQDPRLIFLRGQSTTEDDPSDETIRVSIKVKIAGVDDKTFNRTLTIARNPGVSL